MQSLLTVYSINDKQVREKKEYNPIPFTEELPLPVEGKTIPIRKYTDQEKEQLEKEVYKYVHKEGNQRYLIVAKGINILTGNSKFTDIELVLTAMMLIKLIVKTWYEKTKVKTIL